MSVRNEGIGNAGTLMVSADRADVTDGGGIFSSTQSGEGGNLELRLNEGLFLRNQGVIDSEAFGDGNGGNILVEAPVIVGLENSDIVANAVTGNGGNVSITTQGILGLEFREQRTPQNDITASSQFGVSGEVEINNFGVDPDSGIVELSNIFADSSDQVAQGCSNSSRNDFIATGRGGIPISPSSLVSHGVPWRDLRAPSDVPSTRPLTNAVSGMPVIAPATVSNESVAETLTEANGWQLSMTGEINLTTTKATQPSLHAYATCSSR